MDASISVESIDLPAGSYVMIGHSPFLKVIEDIYEKIMEVNPDIKFGLAYSYSDEKRLIRTEGNNGELIDIAIRTINKIGGGNMFALYFDDYSPVGIFSNIRDLNSIDKIYVLTKNPLQLLIGETEQGRGILGVIDGSPPLSIENDDERYERYNLLREKGYKL